MSGAGQSRPPHPFFWLQIAALALVAAAARAHLARSKALREKMEHHGKAAVKHLRRYAEQQREAARRGR